MILFFRVMMARTKAKLADLATDKAKEDAELAQQSFKKYENTPLEIGLFHSFTLREHSIFSYISS